MADPRVTQWFMAQDKDRTGRLDATQLQQALRNNNQSTFDIAVVQLMIKMFDRDNTGQIDLNEFNQLWNYLGQWRQMFDRFDADRSGHINGSEFWSALQQMGYRFSPQFVETLYRKHDYNRDGTVQFDGFVHSIILIQRLTGAFQQYDVQRNGNAQFTYEQYLLSVITSI